LNKERSLRGQMSPWSERRLLSALSEAGFHVQDVQSFWQSYLFVAKVAVKNRA